MKRLLALILLLIPSLTYAESDVRDVEGAAFASNNSLVTFGYFRHASGTDNHEADQAVFRGLYLMRFGDLILIPIDVFVFAADITGYTSAGVVNPALASVNFALRGQGLSDITYLPSLSYVVHEGASVNHTVLQFNPHLTLPTGNYDPTKPLGLNVGENRLTFTPYIGIGQRFASAFTAELYGFMAFHGPNSKFEIPATASSAAVTTTRSQAANVGLDFHLGWDVAPTFFLGASYYLLKQGEATVAGALQSESVTTQTVRFNFGIRLAKTTVLLLQYNHDLTASNGGAISQFFGARISHVISLDGPAPRATPQAE